MNCMTKNENGSAKIHAALKKLKNESNAKELELIEVISSIYENVMEKKEETVEKIKEKANDVNTSVHLHPWHYIGGAFACGFFAGLLLKRH